MAYESGFRAVDVLFWLLEFVLSVIFLLEWSHVESNLFPKQEVMRKKQQFVVVQMSCPIKTNESIDMGISRCCPL